MKNIVKHLNLFISKNFWIFIWNYWMGCTKMVRHKYKAAIDHFNSCLKIDISIDKGGLVYEHLGKSYFDINEIEKSKECFLKVLNMREKDLDNLNSEITSRLGFIFYLEKDHEKARYYLRQAMAKYKKSDYTNISAVKEYIKKLNEIGK